MGAALPSYRVIEKTLNENDLFASPHLLPCIEAAFTARQKPVRSRVPETASIEIAFHRKDDAVSIGITTAGIHQPCLAQHGERVTPLAQPRPKATARSIADAHVPDDLGRVESALLQVRDRFAMAG